MAKNYDHLLKFFISLNRGGSQNWWPRCSPTHYFNKSPHKCFNLVWKSTAGCLSVKSLVACRHILGNISFITLSIYIFVKTFSILFLVSDLPLFHSLVYSPLQHPAFLPQRDKISSEDRFFSSFLHLIHLSFPFLLYANPYPMWKRSLKAILYISQPQTKPSRQKKDIKVTETWRNNTQVPLLAAAEWGCQEFV